MGMLMHHTWLSQQHYKEQPGKKETPAPAVKAEAETEKPPVKRTGGRPKKK